MSVISATQGIRDEIARRINELETDNTDAFTDWIHLCLRDVQLTQPNLTYWQTSADRTLSAGTRQYSNLPTDFDKMNTITYPAGNITLRYLEPEQFDLLFSSASQQGSPVTYTIRGQGANGRIEFQPLPSTALTVHYDYLRAPTTVSTGSSVPDLPTKYFELPILFGESRGLRRKGLRTEAAEVQKEYEILKEKMIQDLNHETTEMQSIKSNRDFQNTDITSDPVRNAFWIN